MVGFWLVGGTQLTDLMVNRCHAMSTTYWLKMIQSSHQKNDEDAKMSSGEHFFGSDESEVDDDDWR